MGICIQNIVDYRYKVADQWVNKYYIKSLLDYQEKSLSRISRMLSGCKRVLKLLSINGYQSSTRVVSCFVKRLTIPTNLMSKYHHVIRLSHKVQFPPLPSSTNQLWDETAHISPNSKCFCAFWAEKVHITGRNGNFFYKVILNC